MIRNVFKIPTRRETNIPMHRPTQLKLTEPEQAVLIICTNKSDHKMVRDKQFSCYFHSCQCIISVLFFIINKAKIYILYNVFQRGIAKTLNII